MYFEGRRVKKEDIQIERSFLELMSSNYIAQIFQTISNIPRKQAAEYLGLSEILLLGIKKKESLSG